MPGNKSRNILFVILWLFTLSAVGADRVSSLENPRTRLLAPEISLPEINVFTKNTFFKLSELKGKLVIVNFWSLDCVPCLTEMGSLNRLSREYFSDGLRVVAIAVNNSAQEIRAYQKEKKWSFRMLVDPHREIRKLYEVDAIPVSYIIGRDGRFVARVKGSRNWFSADIRRQIEIFLKSR